MPVVGTAGHVDHGKSTLIEALTGRDPDRWEEEKRRGLTLDLGFAWATLDDGSEVSFVDVPGHERYLKNMLAGIEAIDVALFTVAADEGWKPQSEEHLAVLDLLDIRRGVVALTKVDLTDPDTVELRALEVADHLSGTTLEGARIIPVSARTGAGLEQLRSHLSRLVLGLRPGHGRPRMWVDRAFSVRGAGTVVTGTLLGGELSVGDTVEILPGGRLVRIRALESHETGVQVAEAGRRLAINLSDISREEVARGAMVGIPGQWMETDRFTARVTLARYVDVLGSRGAYQVHLGSGAHRAEILRIESTHALIRLGSPLPLSTGDRFIIRDTGRKLVVAGGIVLDPSPGKTKQALAAASEIDPLADADARATMLLGTRGSDTLHRLAAHSGGGMPTSGVVLGEWVFTDRAIEELGERARSLVATAHHQHPLRPGLPLATLANALGVTLEIAQLVVDGSEQLAHVGPDVALAGREVELSEEDRLAWDRARARLGESLRVPVTSELGLDAEQLHLLVRTGRVVRVAPDLVFLPEQVDHIEHVLDQMPDSFTVADFRDRSGLSRKYAVPILEWADEKGLTVRRGDVRSAR